MIFPPWKLDGREIGNLKEEGFAGALCEPYSTSPIAVEKAGCWTSSIIPFTLVGSPTRTGIASVRLADSFIPTVSAPPPVRTIPAGVCPPNPDFFISSPIIAQISFNRGFIMPSIRVFWETFLMSSDKFKELKSISSVGLPSRPSTSSPSWSLKAVLLEGSWERNNFIFSALSIESLKPIAKSLVTWRAPIAKTEEYATAPST